RHAAALRTRPAQRDRVRLGSGDRPDVAGETGQDNLGDEFPPDEIDLIEAGAHYGFPFFIGANRLNVGQPELEGKTPNVTAADARPPALEVPAHSSPIDRRFYAGTVFPAARVGDPINEAPIVVGNIK